MLKSMTGFGHGEYELNNKKFSIDIKTVNAKFLDISIKMPRALIALEEKIKKQISNTIIRGTVEVFINFFDYNNSNENVILNLELAKKLYDAGKELSNSLSLDNNLTVRDVLKFNDVLSFEITELNLEEIEPILFNALDKAIQALDKMRFEEGKNLEKDLLSKISNIENNMNKIIKIAPSVEIEYAKKLRERISELLGETPINEEKLINEVAFFADKSDINEEIVRMQSHINQFKEITKDNEPSGKRYEFLAQEMTRETNTLGSKANFLDLTNLVLYQKNEIEKIKEQIRNVE